MHKKLSLMFKTNNFVKTRYIYIYTLYKNWQLSRTTWEGGGLITGVWNVMKILGPNLLIISLSLMNIILDRYR